MECDEGKSTELDDVPREGWLYNDGTTWNDNDTTITFRGEWGRVDCNGGWTYDEDDTLTVTDQLTSFDFLQFILPPESSADPEEGSNLLGEGREEKVNKY